MKRADLIKRIVREVRKNFKDMEPDEKAFVTRRGVIRGTLVPALEGLSTDALKVWVERIEARTPKKRAKR